LKVGVACSFAVRDHDRGVDVQHHRLAQVGPGDLAGRDGAVPLNDLSPHVTADPSPRSSDLLQPARRDRIQRPPHRRRRRDRTEHADLVAQHVDVSDRLTTIGEHHRNVREHPAPVMDRDERTPCHRLRQLVRQAGSICQQPQRNTARVSYHADTITGHGQAGGPRSTLHLRSAFHLELLGLSQEQESQAGQALPCFYTPITPTGRERSGLAVEEPETES